MSINPSNSIGSSSSPHSLDPSKTHREMLFEKPLTPSDVGKLNRLVVPKQYAEKYFPLRGSSGASLLSFEDEFGKIWRFRYSYWSSSQSYVLTKGWSRYVKEKGLMSGDIVSFHRQQCTLETNYTDRFYITWRTRPYNVLVPTIATKYISTGCYWSRKSFFPAPHPYCPTRLMMNKLSQEYPGEEDKMVSITNTPRRLRLFGVNMESEESESSDLSSEVSTLLNLGLGGAAHHDHELHGTKH